MELRFKKFQRSAHNFVDIHGLKVGGGHLGKVAEAADDHSQVRQFGEQRGSAFAKNLVKFARMALTSAQQILNRNLKREEGIL